MFAYLDDDEARAGAVSLLEVDVTLPLGDVEPLDLVFLDVRRHGGRDAQGEGDSRERDLYRVAVITWLAI